MLALNEHLGYRPLLVAEDWFRGERVAGPS